VTKCLTIVSTALVLFLGVTALAKTRVLDRDQMRSALFLETVTLPSPGEFFAAVDKQFQPNWSQLVRPAVPVATHRREHLALQLGVLLADGFVAIEAQDSQAAKNNGRDVLNLARKLNVSQNVLARGQNISDLADKTDWRTLREELDAMQNDIRLSMQEQNDQDLLVFLMIGSWIRQMEIASNLLEKNPIPDATGLLVQPAILDHLLERLGNLPEKTRVTPLAQSFSSQLETLNTPMKKGSYGPLSDESIREIAATLQNLLSATADPPPKP
jgi:hypothetical protein